MPEGWQRHDLLRVAPGAWARWLRGQPPLAAMPLVASWAARRWPLVVRRRTEDDGAGMIPLGIPLPPSCGRGRIAAQVAPGDISERVPPQDLRALRGETPLSWRPTVDAVLMAADQTGVEPRVFGSLLWQRLTGLPYLTATSDLDLLWSLANAECAARLAHLLAAIAEAPGPVRLDGELILPDGGGVQWREWHRGAPVVLVKTLAEVQLRPAAELFGVKALAA